MNNYIIPEKVETELDVEEKDGIENIRGKYRIVAQRYNALLENIKDMGDTIAAGDRVIQELIDENKVLKQQMVDQQNSFQNALIAVNKEKGDLLTEIEKRMAEIKDLRRTFLQEV